MKISYIFLTFVFFPAQLLFIQVSFQTSCLLFNKRFNLRKCIY